MADRTLNFGSDATDADYQVRDTSSTGGDLVVEHLPSGAQFKYNATANQWELVDPLSFGDEAADPAANGVVQRNGTDIKAYSGGAVRNLSNIGSDDLSLNQVSTNTTTSGAGLYLVDTSGGAVTLTLSSTDATNQEHIGVVNVTGTNAVTVDTESTETIDPGGASSKTLSTEGWLVWFAGDGTNWDSSLDVDVESVSTDKVTNSAIGDSVDYIDPVWRGLTREPYEYTDWQNGGRLADNTSGSGSISNQSNRTELNTGGTQGSHAARTFANLSRRDFRDNTGAIAFKTTVQFVNDPEQFGFAVGDIDDIFENSDSREHVGLEYDGALSIVWKTDSDGSQQSTQIESSYSLNQTRDYLVVLVDSNGVEVFDTGGSIGSTSTVDISSFTDDEVENMQVYHSNPDSATDNRVDVHAGEVAMRQ